MPDRKIQRALISVYDKTGIVDFARALVNEFGIEIISTGGTATLLKENGIPVTLVEEVTGFPEMLDGRVKTLHPKIHAAILADRDNPEHMRQLAEQGIKPIDMVVVNLYPFEKTVADPNCTFEQAIEMIDIGGPCLLRAAAKNHKDVLAVYDPEAYTEVLRVLRGEWNYDDIQVRYCSGVFGVTCCYDGDIARWIGESERLSHCMPHLPFYHFPASNWGPLRYGENPHQQAQLLESVEEVVDEPEPDLIVADAMSDVDEQSRMSLNNYVDGHAALELCKELTRASLQCGTGFQPVSECGTGFQPVRKRSQKSTLQPLDDERYSRRNLPHIETPGKTYFITFRLAEPGALAPTERDIVLRACLHWHGSRIDLDAAVVMPDHVHLLLAPRSSGPDTWYSLAELMHSIKRHTALEINKLRNRSGPLWQDEYFDRIIRNQTEYDEKWAYIANNAITKNLDKDGEYAWFWAEGDPVPAGATFAAADEDRRLKTGGTQAAAQPHRLETGATLGFADDKSASQLHPARVCLFIKHTNACGVGIAADPIAAYQRAYLGDANAAMGGILSCNFEIDEHFAAAVMETYDRWGKPAGAGGFFVEVWVAPAFADKAIEIIRTKKPWGERVRLLYVGDMSTRPNEKELEHRQITGGMLVQTRDLIGLNEDQWRVETKRQPSESEMVDLRLAWLIAKHTKSNAISICKDGMLIGNGAGQMSRVMSCRIATWLANENGHAEKLKSSAAASDAFFPFADGPKILIDAGVTAIIQPGGSKRDEDTIKLCDERGVAMIFTGTRHFKH